MSDASTCELLTCGVLARDAEVIVLPNSFHTALPAIRLYIASSPRHRPIVVDWPRPTQEAARNEAAKLLRGQLVRLHAPLEAYALHIHGATQVVAEDDPSP